MFLGLMRSQEMYASKCAWYEGMQQHRSPLVGCCKSAWSKFLLDGVLVVQGQESGAGLVKATHC